METTDNIPPSPPRRRKPAQPAAPLKPELDPSKKYEIGVDEAGRGPLFGRLYVAGVILPKGDDFDHSRMKDSKKFHSEKKIREVAEYIRQHCLAYHIAYIEPTTIDEINIRQAVLRAMTECCRVCLGEIQSRHVRDHPTEPALVPHTDVLLLIDGNDFPPFMVYDETNETMLEIPHETVEGGDNTYTAIAAASILAKVARDDYIAECCRLHPALDEKYGLAKNKGYGTKTHLDGIRTHGISQWHRRSFGICQHSPVVIVETR
jgi:ribonuclease HII